MGELPSFQQSYNDHAGAFEILSIGSPGNDPNAPGFVEEKGYTWDFAYSDEALKQYKIRSIPFTLFIDGKGNIVSEKLGAMSHSDFEAQLKKIL